MLHLHPAKWATFLEKLTRIPKRKEKIFFKKTFQKSLPERKDFVTFAPANRKTGTQKKVRHVPRHIELTAVPMQIGTKE